MTGTDNRNIEIKRYEPAYADAAVLMWRESKEKAIGLKEIHTISEHRHYLNEILSKTHDVFVAIKDEAIAGIIAFDKTEIAQLYIHVDFQGRGIGKLLLDMAKAESSGRLTLYTFEVNCKAQRFYERNGFKVIGRGYENEENLDDIKYEWTRRND